MNETDLLRDQAAQARRLVVEMAGSPVGCHLGGSLSVLDILIASYAVARSGPGMEASGEVHRRLRRLWLRRSHTCSEPWRRCRYIQPARRQSRR